MPNTYLTSQIIVNELLREFKNNLGFTATIPHGLDGNFGTVQGGAKPGDTLNLSVPLRFLAKKQAQLDAQAVEHRKVALQVTTQAHVGFQFSSFDRTLSISKFNEKVGLRAAALALANQVDVDGLTLAYQMAPNFIGAPGTTPTALKTFKQAAAWLDKQAAPFDGDRYFVIDSDAETEIIDSLKTLFHDSAQVKQQYLKGRMGTAMGGDWIMDQNVRTHEIGALGGSTITSNPVVSGAGQTGTTLSTSGWDASITGILKKGDIISIAGVYAVNPVSGDTLKDLRRFTVTADVNSAADGTAEIPIACEGVGRGIVVSGPYKNCSASPGNGAAIYVWDKAAAKLGDVDGVKTVQNLVYHRNALIWACPALDMPPNVEGARQVDPKTGIGIRIVSQYNISEDQFITRADIIYGWAAPIPEWICRVAG